MRKIVNIPAVFCILTISLFMTNLLLIIYFKELRLIIFEFYIVLPIISFLYVVYIHNFIFRNHMINLYLTPVLVSVVLGFSSIIIYIDFRSDEFSIVWNNNIFAFFPYCFIEAIIFFAFFLMKGRIFLFISAVAIPFAATHAFCICLMTNCLLDKTAPVLYFPQIIDKHIVSGGKTAGAHLLLAEWGPVKEREDYRVSMDVYNKVGAGRQVCAQLSPGYIGVEWYILSDCSNK